MIVQIFKAFLVTSFVGTVLAGVLTLLQPITKKIFGFRWHYYIWIAVLLVMMLPVRFSLPQHTDLSIPGNTVSQTQIVEENQHGQTNFGQNQPVAETPTAETTATHKELTLVNKMISGRMNDLGIAWLVGMLLMFAVSLIGYIRLIIKIHKHSIIIPCAEIENYTNKKIVVRSCKELYSPFMIGLFRPTLVLPETEFGAEQLDNILRHEMTHFKRKDIWYKWFAVIVRCVHWFNPAVYYIVRQINMECEISCDLSVVAGMDKENELSYVNTILLLLSNGKSKSISLTTGMTGSKKILKRRFTMIKNKKATNKIMSVLSACVAVAMLTTTVFASGLLSDRAAASIGTIGGADSPTSIQIVSENTLDCIVELLNNGEKIELVNQPFVENNGGIYFPLRETLEKVGAMGNKNSYLKWNDGKTELCIAYNDNMGFYDFEIGGNMMNAAHQVNNITDDVAVSLQYAPVLRNNTTYMSIDNILYMLKGFSAVNEYAFGYIVYDKQSGEIIAANSNAKSSYTHILGTEAESTIRSFFSAFENSDFEKMKTYCTQNCIDNFFGNGFVFGMERAELKTLTLLTDLEPSEIYDENTAAFDVTASIKASPDAVFGDISEHSFFMVCKKQGDGGYLIDSFATGL